MPQIWATYREIAATVGQSPETIRAAAKEHSLPRRRSSDGETRVKLPPGLAVQLILDMPEVKSAIEQSIRRIADRESRAERIDRLYREIAEIRAEAAGDRHMESNDIAGLKERLHDAGFVSRAA